MKSAKKAVTIVLSVILWVVILLAALFAFTTLATRDVSKVSSIAGYTPMTVQSDSMAPTFEKGDLILIRKCDPATLEEGDIIKINIPANTIDVAVSDEEMAVRRAKWQPREPKVTTGYLARYAKMVSDSCKGAVLEK